MKRIKAILNLTKLSLVIFLTAYIFSGQIIAQEYLNNFPKPKNGNTYVIAHRGVHNNIPENTLAAYQNAIDLGCDFVEIDIRKTKDGKFVSVHNSTVDAYVEGIKGKVSSFTLTELKQMNIGKRISPEWENERIPTFEEILQLCKGQIGIYLDLKEHLADELIPIIKRYEMEQDIVWYIPAFYMKEIKKVKKNCYKCIVMPDPGKENNISKLVKKVQPFVIATDMSNLNESYVKTAHENNSKVFTDDEAGNIEEWKKIIKWGTDGIQTDQPERLIKFLKKQNLLKYKN